VPKLRFPGFEGEWERTSLGEKCKIIMGQSPDSASYNTIGVGIPLVQGNADIKNRVSCPNRHTSKPTKICRPNSVLLSVRAPVGTVGIANQTLCLGRGVCAIESDNNAFLYQFLIFKEDSWRNIEQGGTFTAINGDDIKKFTFIMPCEIEREKIATFLSLIDSSIATQRKLVELLKKHKRGLIKRLFRPNEHTKWKSVRLGEVGTFHKGAPLSKADISEDGKPFILYGELYTTYGEIIKDVVRRTTAEIDIPYLSRCGDVIIPTSGETAEEIATASCIMSDGVVLGGDLNIYRSEHIDGRFLAYAVRFIISRDISRIAQGVSVVHISATELKRISVSIPSKDEQIRIISVLENYDNRILHSYDILKKLEVTKDGLLQQLFV